MAKVRLTNPSIFKMNSFSSIAKWFRLRDGKIEEICRGTVFDETCEMMTSCLQSLSQQPARKKSFLAGMTSTGVIFQDFEIDWKKTRIIKRLEQYVFLLRTKTDASYTFIWAPQNVLTEGFEITENADGIRIVVSLIVAVEERKGGRHAR